MGGDRHSRPHAPERRALSAERAQGAQQAPDHLLHGDARILRHDRSVAARRLRECHGELLARVYCAGRRRRMMGTLQYALSQGTLLKRALRALVLGSCVLNHLRSRLSCFLCVAGRIWYCGRGFKGGGRSHRETHTPVRHQRPSARPSDERRLRGLAKLSLNLFITLKISFADFVGDLADSAEAARRGRRRAMLYAMISARALIRCTARERLAPTRALASSACCLDTDLAGRASRATGVLSRPSRSKSPRARALSESAIAEAPSKANAGHARFQAQRLIAEADAALRRRDLRGATAKSVTIVFDDVTFKPRAQGRSCSSLKASRRQIGAQPLRSGRHPLGSCGRSRRGQARLWDAVHLLEWRGGGRRAR